MQNLCWKKSARPFVNAKIKKRCQLKCCNLKFINKRCLQMDLMFIFCVCQYGRLVNMAAKQKLSCRVWLVPVSFGQPCFVLVWSGPITSQEKCIQKWISTGLVSVILSLFSALAAAFQCCGVLLSLLMIQSLRQRQLTAILFWFNVT